jgi:hypothetical protein
VPLSQAITLNDAVFACPESSVTDRITNEWIDRAISALINVPQEVVNNIPMSQKIDVIMDYFWPLCGDLLRGFTAETYNRPYFYLKYEKLYLPRPRKVFNEQLYFTDEKTIVYSEIADLITGDNYLANMDKIMCILCRRKNEPYSEELVFKRQAEMLNIPMDIVWQVFFWLAETGLLFVSTSRHCLSAPLSLMISRN